MRLLIRKLLRMVFSNQRHFEEKNKQFTKTGVKRLRIGFQQDLKCHIGNFSVVVNKKKLQETDFR